MTTKRITLYKPIRTQEQLKTDHVYIMAHSSTSSLSIHVICLFCLLFFSGNISSTKSTVNDCGIMELPAGSEMTDLIVCLKGRLS